MRIYVIPEPNSICPLFPEYNFRSFKSASGSSSIYTMRHEKTFLYKREQIELASKRYFHDHINPFMSLIR